ncbi:NAD(+) synthase [Planktosalinus lacus]|uniref:NH(3)-dependent NAD(+) synthetase n=1 Tax=Planktosalinus lacus TaxID=1526573 RepID=A0A8J2Y9N4_9FLAO|nr:NAD(+) synthase [Planktosalinus lacus]GGD89422.1 NH(3)-dependent NAD(+) synthetase [Planktosalinus lacus]
MQTENVVKHIVNWLKEYATSSKMDGFVVGISGGIDSAVTSALCAKTGMRTLCVEMPIQQSMNQVNRGKEHIEKLQKKHANVSSIEVNLTPVFETFKTQIPTNKMSPLLNLTLANTRARLRMTTLYYFAGLHRYLVVGTGNKVEDFGVGFFTKYGDGGVDISPIADLMKSEVFQLGSHLNISESILKAKPTDGLFGDDRSDEDQLGASYDELEWAMKMDQKGSEISNFSGREQLVFSIYKNLNSANQHKMNPIPVCKIPLNFKK